MVIYQDSPRDLSLSLGDYLGNSEGGGIPNTVSEDTVIYVVLRRRTTARFLGSGYCDISARREDDSKRMEIPHNETGIVDWKAFIKEAYSLTN